jgi:hypothetical protein
MNAEPFYGNSEYPVVIDTADDGTPLPKCKGWWCAGCGTLYATQDVAEMCCQDETLATVEPSAVVNP